MLKSIIQFKLKYLARFILSKYKPRVVSITGSVGKTSAKEAIFAVLKNNFKVRQSQKNYNNEFGLPLTVIGMDSPGRNIFGWLAVFFKALGLLLFQDKNYPKILILELGVDKIGDMDYLNDFIASDIGVITSIGTAHLEAFGSIEKIQKEKGKLIENLNKNGWAIINFDDERAMAIAKNSKAKVISFGFNEGADVRAENLIYKFQETKSLKNLLGLNFKVNYKGSSVPVVLPKVIGTPAVYAALAAIGAGLALEMNLVEAVAALREFDSPRGRTKLISGIKETLIIDDTYNASPQSSLAAINFISQINTEEHFRRVAIFGEMLELGNYTDEGHHEVGQALARAGFDLIITVGARTREIIHGALDSGLTEDKLFNFPDNYEAGLFAQERIKQGDLILIKGSQGARMEKVVKELMAEPLKAGELLVRQGKEWLDL